MLDAAIGQLGALGSAPDALRGEFLMRPGCWRSTPTAGGCCGSRRGRSTSSSTGCRGASRSSGSLDGSAAAGGLALARWRPPRPSRPGPTDAPARPAASSGRPEPGLLLARAIRPATAARAGEALGEQARRPAGEGGRTHRRQGDADGRAGAAGGGGPTRPGDPQAQRPPPPSRRSSGSARAVAADAKSEMQRDDRRPGAVSPTCGFMEPRLRADLGDVRVHADESAASLSNHLSARAFTYRNHVFFARDQYQPGTPRAGTCWPTSSPTPSSRAPQSSAPSSTARRPARAGDDPLYQVGSPPAVQRLGVQDASTTSPTRRTTSPTSGC